MIEALNQHVSWRTSSYTANQTSCVEVGCAPGVIRIRDSKDREGGALHIAPAIFSTFVSSIKASQLH